MTTLIQPPPPGYRKWWWVPAVFLVAALVVAATLWLTDLLRPGDGCDAGLDRNESGQCVGVTDGSEQFTDDLADLTGRIRDENRTVVDSGDPYVSIVLLTPMTTGDSDEGNVTMAGIQHRLAGAHLAQLSANKTSSWGSRTKIRLLLANPGSDFASWESVVDTIVQRRTTDQIVAVTGISFSFKKAITAIERLINLEEPVPVFASTLTIDKFRGARAFLKVSPPAVEHARAAAEFLADDDGRILIVRDNNPGDEYGSTLADAFQSQFPSDSPNFDERPENFQGDLDNLSDAFRLMMANICDRKPSTIYFAGRGDDAIEFLIQLAQRDCREKPIQVITADDMPYHQLADSAAGKALEGNVTLRYTGLAHPDAWDLNRNDFNPIAIDQFSPECQGPICYRAFSDGDVHDFAAVMEYDAVLAAVQATRLATGDAVDSNAVSQMMGQMRFKWAFYGASGKLDFIDGLPHDKPILILEARNGRPPLYLESR